MICCQVTAKGLTKFGYDLIQANHCAAHSLRTNVLDLHQSTLLCSSFIAKLTSGHYIQHLIIQPFALLEYAGRHYCHTATSCNFLLIALLSFASDGSLKLAVSTHVKADSPDSTIIAVL